MFTMPLLEKVEGIANASPDSGTGGNRRSWAIRELVKEAIEAREKGVAR